MKGYAGFYATFSNEIAYSLHNAGFMDSNTAKSLMTDDGYFNFVYSSAYCSALVRITNVWQLMLVTN